MATYAPITGARRRAAIPEQPQPPIALLRAFPSGPLAKLYGRENAKRLKRLATLFASFDRSDMEVSVDLLLAEMDARDGEADLENDGDELDGNGSEDDFMWHSPPWTHAPGCPIADPVEEDDDDGCAAGDDNLSDWGLLAGEVCEPLCGSAKGFAVPVCAIWADIGTTSAGSSFGELRDLRRPIYGYERPPGIGNPAPGVPA